MRLQTAEYEQQRLSLEQQLKTQSTAQQKLARYVYIHVVYIHVHDVQWNPKLTPNPIDTGHFPLSQLSHC